MTCDYGVTAFEHLWNEEKTVEFDDGYRYIYHLCECGAIDGHWTEK